MTEKQTIFRAAHGEQKPYFLMARSTAQDSRLSFDARGVIAYLLSKPLNWSISKENLMNEGNIGRTKMKRIMDELIEAGYMTRDQANEDGVFGPVVYYLHEEPRAENAQAVSRDRLHENRQADTRAAENVPQHNIESTEYESQTELPSATAPDAFKPIQTMLVETVYDGNNAAWGKAGDIANWALCRNDKKPWADYPLDRPFDAVEFGKLLAWYPNDRIEWPEDAFKWNKWAYTFRKEHAAAVQPQKSETSAQKTLALLNGEPS